MAKKEETAPKPPQHVSCLLRIANRQLQLAKASLSVLLRCGCSLDSATTVIATCMLSRYILAYALFIFSSSEIRNPSLDLKLGL